MRGGDYEWGAGCSVGGRHDPLFVALASETSGLPRIRVGGADAIAGRPTQGG